MKRFFDRLAFILVWALLAVPFTLCGYFLFRAIETVR